MPRTVWWEAGAVCLIDQTLLPHEQVIVRCRTLEQVAHAIKSMQVRGAPAIGITAAYGLALVAQESPAQDVASLIADLRSAKALLDQTRPTAINLSWATARMLRRAEAERAELPRLRQALLDEAQAIRDEDEAMCRAIGRHGAALLQGRRQVLTHCNAGGLATAAYGTALAPLYTLHETGQPVHVYVDETRPFLQGARLTAWELQQAGVPLTLITDNMAGYFMRQRQIDCVIVGADRIVANGDVANKIGTYSLAVLARAHNIPFYVAAPTSTLDLSLPNGDAIPIEQRAAEEVTRIGGRQIAPEDITAAHPAFDITPAELVSAIITERGVVEPPYEQQLRALFEDDQLAAGRA